MAWNSESQVKLVFVLPVNKSCAFPSVHLMETRDLLMMITPGEVPPVPVLPQPSSLRSAQWNLCLESPQRTCVLLAWHFLQRRKDISFPARAWWRWQRKAGTRLLFTPQHMVLEGFALVEGHVGTGIAGRAVGEGRPEAPSGMLPPVFPSSSPCSETRRFGWVLCFSR